MSDFQTDVRVAMAQMREAFPETPLQRSSFLSDRYGAEIWLKREDLTEVRSYKLRGAFAFFTRALAEGRATRFACASAGNHAQGFAWCCARMGVTGTIFMPSTTPGQKVEKTKAFGGDAVDIQLVGDFFDDCLGAAKAFVAETGACFVPPFDAPETILGQATVTAEILDQLGHAPDMLVMPVGGGGLSAGARKYLQAVGAPTELLLVEPGTAPSLAKALEHGAPFRLPKISNFVDGAAVAEIGSHPFAALKGMRRADVFAVPEDRLCGTLVELLNSEGIVLEPAGALAIDVLQDIEPERLAGKTVVCAASGGNFDFERLPEVKERALRYRGLKKYYVIRLPQRPGALKDFLLMLGPKDDIFRFEYLKKSARNFGSVLIGIDTDKAENFERLVTQMDAYGIGWRDITDSADLVDLIV
ncbi:threonine dehydratase [Rubricella aquisinus]|uniref:L-threonine dehydratase n=1 Tax=Rubricella aquisinus TaxID=2028108 RepID=A0A840X1R9_9RHOB|nr:threonine ammonia-lyase IlvA [Rubricella aquisinus]MBB5516724.1 threonine dehydratase [Rubricella aquisinus]